MIRNYPILIDESLYITQEMYEVELMDTINWLQDWYKQNCDGDWEHNYGINIYTVDNPGWSVNIELTDTNLEFKNFETI